ncbi:50S ribosomal protein L24 [Pelagicoccus sp. SDUM812003]|uniref:50S ribosomal protein L24 n=1 Tax=Pelagicoccus sp. SDUM812003 TaxID=3041267 RepID=UPI00280C66AB|nr:50S ribosomal protein L24 [Pelagicoccus sp. SDUM812003]MDQ8204841.1 50S ribosomal protein L24 [Pelagicoccus sp. SDUM812003]
MAKTHIKKGDEVIVLTGKEKGKRGKVLQLLPKKDRAIVEGLMMIKRHEKKSEEKPEGAIVEREGSIHVSNLMAATKWDARRSK